MSNRYYKIKFSHCIDQYGKAYYPIWDIFNAQKVSDLFQKDDSNQVILTINFARLNRLFEYPYLEY